MFITGMKIVALPLNSVARCLGFASFTQAEDLLTLQYGEAPSVLVTCEEAKGVLRIAVIPALENGYGTESGGVFNDPFDTAQVEIGTNSLKAAEDATAQLATGEHVYLSYPPKIGQ